MPYTYPTNAELTQLEPELVARKSNERLGLQLMPIRNVNAAKVQWNVRDNYFGMQQLRGIDGSPPRVQRVGDKTFEYDPGAFGEYIQIGETELTKRAASVADNRPVNITDLVTQAQDQLLTRRLDRIEFLNWELLLKGEFKVSSASGAIEFKAAYSVQKYDAAVAWSNTATSTPISDIQDAVLLGQGSGSAFDQGARVYVNQKTMSNIRKNRNAADAYGLRTGGGDTASVSFSALNTYLAGEGLPQFAVYDEGYFNDSNAWTNFIPDNLAVMVGRRLDGSTIGEYIMTRNARNGLQSGPHTIVTDRTSDVRAGEAVDIRVEDGHNGGPVIYRPKSIIVLKIA